MCTPNEQVDDFAVAQRTPLPVCLAGVEGDKVFVGPIILA